MTGLELLRAIQSGAIDPPGFAVTLGIAPVELEEGRAVFELAPGAEHVNPLGVVHGGILSTLLDTAMGCAVHTTLGADQAFATLDLDIRFVRPVRAGQGPVRAEGTLVHAGRRTATAQGRIVDAAGTLYAHGTTTCLLSGEAQGTSVAGNGAP